MTTDMANTDSSAANTSSIDAQCQAQSTNSSITHPTRLTIPDFVTIGVSAALYFLLVFVAVMACGILLPGISNASPALAAILAGSVYMLMVARVQKFGAITIMGTVMGLFFLISGHFPLSFIPFIVCALVADLIGLAGHYRNRIGLLIGYIVFSYGNTGPTLPLYFMKNAYVASLQARGKSTDYINGVFANVNMTTFVISMIAIAVCGVIGGLFGQWMMRKHFVKAGIVS